MADWERDERTRWDRTGRGGREWRDERPAGGPPGSTADEQRSFRGAREHDARRDASYGSRGEYGGGRASRGNRDEREEPYEAEPSPYAPEGGGARGYGEGGDTSYGQMSRGSSDSGLGGYGGANVGGWGQPNLNSQWGQGGFGPLNQGIDYGQDGRSFGPRGYDTGGFGASPRDEHHHNYRRWRDTQLAGHDRDYNRWREEQARRYDEDYNSWRDERHATFRNEFEGWRSGRSAPPVEGQVQAGRATGETSTTVNPSERSVYSASASSAAVDRGAIHGANPTLAKIAEGHEGHQHHKDEDKAQTGEHDTPRH